MGETAAPEARAAAEAEARAVEPVPIDAPAPVRPEDRIQSLDVLRGASILGILLMNINSFGLPAAAYHDPATYGGAEGANLITWFANHVLVEGKFRAIFSMLFGASAILLIGRGERRGAGIELADVYYRRTLWLIVFGVVHGYFIWFGDILFHFGVIGLTLFPLRKLSGRMLCVLGVVALTLHTAQAVRGTYRWHRLSDEIARFEALEQAGRALTEEQEERLEDIAESRNEFKPDAEALRDEIETTRDDYLENLKARASITASLQSDVFYRYLLLDVAGMLLLGMGLMKLGVFDGSRSMRFYAWMAVLGYGIGLPLNIALAVLWVRSNFDLAAMFAYIRVPTDLVRFSIAAGHIALVVMICKAGLLRRLTRAMANVGRMALSNYVLMSILCTLFFYGYGLAMFGRLQRFELLYVVAAVWAIVLVFSAVWLKFFRFGPLEWVWRSLTYWKLQPMRLRPQPVVIASMTAEKD